MTTPLTSTCKMPAMEAYELIRVSYESLVQDCRNIIRDCDNPEMRLEAAKFLRHLENYDQGARNAEPAP